MPSADFCCTFKKNRFPSSRESTTCNRSPVVSSTAFSAPPPDLPELALMDMGFAALCQLAREYKPPIRFLSIGTRLCCTLPSDPILRRRPCASLILHLHQVGKGTHTLKLSNMHGTQRRCAWKAQDAFHFPTATATGNRKKFYRGLLRNN